MITSINIENLSYSNFYAIHSPFVVTARVLYNDVIPTRVLVDVSKYENGSWILLNTYRAIPFSDNTFGDRIFIFSISELIRGYLAKFDDTLQNLNTFINTQVEKFLIRMYDETQPSIESIKDFYTLPRAKQFGQDSIDAGEALYSQRPIILLENHFFYVHFFSLDEDLSIYKNNVEIENYSNETGCRRYKFSSNDTNSIWSHSAFVGRTDFDLIKRSTCSNDLIIKYLDKNGMYCFYNLQKYYTTKDQPTKIGSVNKVITDLKTDQTSSQNVGYRSTRIINAITEVQNDFLEYFADLYTSPRVYLQINKAEPETAANWLEVKLRANENLVRASRGNLTVINITIELPEQFNITML